MEIRLICAVYFNGNIFLESKVKKLTVKKITVRDIKWKIAYFYDSINKIWDF